MKNLITIIFLFPIICAAQITGVDKLSFNKKYFECEDKWVVFPKEDKDSTYTFGFIYLDEQAGFTFNLESEFKITEEGEFIGYPKDTTSSFKYRLEPNTNLVSILSEDILIELNLTKEPDWLHFYKTNEGTTKSLVSRGYHYNHVGVSNIAIQNLEKAYEIDPKFDGLEFELSYAYNATEQYDKSVLVLKEAIKTNPDNYFFYRELGYAQVRLNEISAAEKTYKEGIKMSDDKYQKSEMAINMTQAFFKIKDKKKFKKWAELTKKYADKDSQFLKYIQIWENEMQ